MDGSRQVAALSPAQRPERLVDARRPVLRERDPGPRRLRALHHRHCPATFPRRSRGASVRLPVGRGRPAGRHDISSVARPRRLARAAASGHAVSAQALHLPDGWALSFEASAPTTGEAAQVWRQPLSLCLDVAAGNWAEVAFGHLNWQQALSAWLDTLQSLQNATQANAGLAAWLGPDLLALQADLVRALSELCQAAQADTQAAQALATSAAPTLWALGVLTALQQAR